MIKFVKIKLDRKNKIYKNINFLENIFNLYQKYENFLNDDYTQPDLLEEVLSIVERTSPFFWVVLSEDKFAGFVFLENIIGNEKNLHSAEITTCFEQEFWGDFTKKSRQKIYQLLLQKTQIQKVKRTCL